MAKDCLKCGKVLVPGGGAHGLCHTHTNAYYRSKERIPKHLKRLNEMVELVQIVEGKESPHLDVSGTSYNK